jgi:hypothetical protein
MKKRPDKVGQEIKICRRTCLYVLIVILNVGGSFE